MDGEEGVWLLESLMAESPPSSIEIQVFKQAWKGESYDSIAQSCRYTPDYIRHIGSSLFKRLSEMVGEPVNKHNLKAVFSRYKRHHQVVIEILKSPRLTLRKNSDATSNGATPISSGYQDWGEAIALPVFYGRQQERAILNDWILSDRARLIAICGTGGIGKTSLCVKLARDIQPEFEYLIWRSLYGIPTLHDLLGSLLRAIATRPDFEMPESTANRLGEWISCLQQHRCLVILDNFETLFKTGKLAGCYRDGYENYTQLLKWVGEVEHQSCVLLTSREEPITIASLEGELFSVRMMLLEGLETQAGQYLLRAKGLTGTAEQMRQVVSRYHGHPLALKIAATSIKNLFLGNVGEFLEQNWVVFNDLHVLLKEQYDRLSFLERKIVYCLALYDAPISLSEIQINLKSVASQGEILEGINSLQRRSLVERRPAGFGLQPMWLDYRNQLDLEPCGA